MPEQDSEPKKGFKVVDRRRFTEDGDARTGPDVAPDTPRRADPSAAASPPASSAAPVGPEPTTDPFAGSPASASNAAPPAGAPPGAPKAAPPEEVTQSGLTFSIFLQSLAQQALMQLGLIPWPHGQRELHMEQARDTIDIVTLLKSKTKGNLNAEEQKLMDAVVYELRMSYVEVQTAIARSKGAQAPRPPGR
jgi:hypothetical protein